MGLRDPARSRPGADASDARRARAEQSAGSVPRFSWSRPWRSPGLARHEAGHEVAHADRAENRHHRLLAHERASLVFEIDEPGTHDLFHVGRLLGERALHFLGLLSEGAADLLGLLSDRAAHFLGLARD